MENEWMKDPTLKNIEQKKLDYMQQMFFESKKLSQKEMIPFFMALSAKSKKEKISFTKEERSAIIAVLKKYSSPDEIQKMDMLINRFK